MNEKTVEIKELFDQIYLSERHLTSGQTDFVQGCKKYFIKNKTLSEKQLAVLGEIKKYLPDQEVRFSGSVADNWKH